MSDITDSNINNHICFLVQQIKTFRKINEVQLQNDIAKLLDQYSKNNDLNCSLMKVFKAFIPHDITKLNATKIQFLSTAINRVRARYES